MNFNGSYNFEKNIQDIWESLNNPEVLKKCINGCEEFIEKDKNNFLLKIKVKIGPINATFQGSLVLKNINPPTIILLKVLVMQDNLEELREKLTLL